MTARLVCVLRFHPTDDRLNSCDVDGVAGKHLVSQNEDDPTVMRTFVIVGARATSSPDFRLADLPGTSGRLDVLLRCLRAALLVSHGVRRDVVVYLVLLGAGAAARSIRVNGANVRFLRPDERSLAVLVQKTLAAPRSGPDFREVRPGIAVADGGLQVVLANLPPGPLYVLDEEGADLRDAAFEPTDAVFFVGGHLGFDDASQADLLRVHATALSVGPVSVHADDAVTIVSNECDRRGHTRPSGRLQATPS